MTQLETARAGKVSPEMSQALRQGCVREAQGHMRTSTAPISLVDSLAAASASRSLLERRLAQIGMGIVAALSQGQMTISEAEQEFFNLRNLKQVKRLRLCKELIEFFEWGMELDDVSELAPGGLDESYKHMRRLGWQLMRKPVGLSSPTTPPPHRARRSA